MINYKIFCSNHNFLNCVFDKYLKEPEPELEPLFIILAPKLAPEGNFILALSSDSTRLLTIILIGLFAMRCSLRPRKLLSNQLMYRRKVGEGQIPVSMTILPLFFVSA